ncbi:hypothetical protein BDV97DRAFT_398162 [Delphinella strobiligena]|nr:hypothetical protein BDV97DRAFT_398162 [Delphinella strobiligena]
MPLVNPTSSTWTLRLKNIKTTIYLHVDRLTPFVNIKQELLHALKATNPSGLLHGNTIPDSPDDVLFARAVDPNNLEAGWQSVEPEDQEEDVEALFDQEEEEAVRGKGKGKAKVGASRGVFRECPHGAGLRDNAALAFRFRGSTPVEKAPGVGLGLDEGFVDEEEEKVPGHGVWDVELPKYEDVYGIGELQPDEEILTPKANKFADFGP